MIAMVDMGKFDPVDNGVLHYVVVYGYDDQYVHVRNMIPEEIERIEWKLFMSAWHCWFMNQLPNPFAGVGDWQYSGMVVAMKQETIARASSRKPRIIITPAESSEMLGGALNFLQPSPRLARESARLAKKQRPLRRSHGAAVPGRPRDAAALEKTLTAVREAGGSVTLDGHDVTTAADAASRLAALPRDLLAQLRTKLADSLREAHHRREIAGIGIQQAGEPAKLQFTANIDTAGEWVDVDWQGEGALAA